MAKLELYRADTGAFTSFSGANAIVTFEGAHIANIQSITLNTTREVVPLYILGSADPISFNKNKRAIAGSMVLLNFDRDMLIDTLKNRAMNIKYRERVQKGNIAAAGNVTRGYTQRYAGGEDYIRDISGMTDAQIDAFFALNSSVQEFQALTQSQSLNDPQSHGFRNVPITYEDQLPPFDVSVYLANDDGATAHMNIRGCIIMNTGWGLSIDDAVSEKAVTFVARRFEGLRPEWHSYGKSAFADPVPSEYTLLDDPFSGTNKDQIQQWQIERVSGMPYVVDGSRRDANSYYTPANYTGAISGVMYGNQNI